VNRTLRALREHCRTGEFHRSTANETLFYPEPLA
jgi:hypothetical protein